MRGRMSTAKEQLVYPDYKRSSVNIIGSLMEAHRVQPFHNALPAFSSKPLSEYAHLFFILFDGMGYQLLSEKLSGIEGRVSKLERLTSVFPSTTTAAVTSLLTGKTPLEHGYLGWTLYMKEYNSYINALVGTDADEKIDYHSEGIDYHEVLEPQGFLSQMKASRPERSLRYLAPKEFGHSFYTRHTSSGAEPLLYEHEQEFPQIIEGILRNDKPSTNYVYSPFPDYFGHREGLSGPMLNGWFSWFDGFLSILQSLIRGKNAVVLISADHGLIDMKDYYRIDQDPYLMETSIMPPFLEPRFSSFFVKEHMKNQFEDRFTSIFKEDFMLMPRDELFQKGLLGIGSPHKKVDDFIGNYVAIATGQRGIHCNPRHNPEREHRFIADHSGLTGKEMEIPFIVIEE